MDPNTDFLDDILNKLLAANLEVGAAAIVSREGLPIASAIPRGADETRVATMTSALFNLGRHSVMEIKQGNVDEICIKGTDVYLLVVPFGSYAIMLFSATKGFSKSGLSMLSRLGPFKPPGSSGAAATVEKDL